tara:strand:+ start:422 stop:613 length:192 start_codon:yes stop_codon:yes gene_type:complete
MKTIIKHKAVESYDTGENQGSDYKHYVILKDGWKFTEGRCADCSSLFFNTLADFKDAQPEPTT